MSKLRQSQWSNLPSDLITDIADRLDLLEVVRFRSVCQSWNSGSSTASAKIESTQNYEPWFLHYGYGDDKRTSDQCHLVTTENGIINMNLPQLDASCTCIASYEGWLLVFKQGGSMFFFRPFSKTKIDLPQFPVAELSDHVAAFSSPPTCSDCTVCVISRSNDNELELNLLFRGEGNEWIKKNHDCPRASFHTILCAVYSKVDKKFYFFNSYYSRVLSIMISNEQSNIIIRGSAFKMESADQKTKPEDKWFPFLTYFKTRDIKSKLGYFADEYEDVSFSICGTQTELHGSEKYIFNETISMSDHVEESKILRKFKGVWIYPRFYQVSPKEQSW